MGIRQRDRSRCGQCPGPASEAGFKPNPTNFRRASSPQKAVFPPSPLTPEVGGRGVGRGRRRQGWLSQGGHSVGVCLGGVGTGTRHFSSLISACVVVYVCQCVYFKTNNKWKENYKEAEGAFGVKDALVSACHTHTRIHPSQPHMPHTYHALTLRGLPTGARVLLTDFRIRLLSCLLPFRSPLARLPGRRHPGLPRLPRAIYQM